MIDNSFEHAMSVEGPELLKLELKKYPTPKQYIDRTVYESAQKRQKLFRVAADAAFIVEPEDKALGADPEAPKSIAFLQGAALGIRVAREFLPRQVIDNMPHTATAQAAKNTYKEQTPEEHAQQGELLMDIGGRGLAYAENYYDLLEELEEEVVPRVIDQHFFRTGFGFVMSMMHEAWDMHLEIDRQQLQEKLDHPETYIDWDAGLAELLGDAE